MWKKIKEISGILIMTFVNDKIIVDEEEIKKDWEM